MTNGLSNEKAGIGANHVLVISILPVILIEELLSCERIFNDMKE